MTVTKPKPPDQLTRPNGAYFDGLRTLLACPICGPWIAMETYPHPPMAEKENQLRVVAYRSASARFECPHCGFRFTMPHGQLATCVQRLNLKRQATE